MAAGARCARRGERDPDAELYRRRYPGHGGRGLNEDPPVAHRAWRCHTGGGRAHGQERLVTCLAPSWSAWSGGTRRALVGALSINAVLRRPGSLDTIFLRNHRTQHRTRTRPLAHAPRATGSLSCHTTVVVVGGTRPHSQCSDRSHWNTTGCHLPGCWSVHCPAL